MAEMVWGKYKHTSEQKDKSWCLDPKLPVLEERALDWLPRFVSEKTKT